MIIIQQVNNISSNNTKKLDFISSSDIIRVKESWWNRFSRKQRNDIMNYFRSSSRYNGYLIVKDTDWKDLQDIQNKVNISLLDQFLDAYKSSFNMNHWYFLLDSHIITHRNYLKDQNVSNYIEKYIKENETTGIFYKTKGKQSNSPKFCLMEIEKEIDTKSNDYILFSPWNYEMNNKNRFSVFVINKNIKGISQYKSYKYVGLDKQTLLSYSESIVNFYTENKGNIPYSYCILNVWVTDSVEVKIFNIEPLENVTGLFTYDELMLISDGSVIVRYIDIKSPMLMSMNRSMTKSIENLGTI
jgi:hypothetical protein